MDEIREPPGVCINCNCPYSGLEHLDIFEMVGILLRCLQGWISLGFSEYLFKFQGIDHISQVLQVHGPLNLIPH